MSKKKRNFIASDEDIGADLILGDLDRALEYVRACLEELKDGEDYSLEIKRHDMTEEEMEKAPVI